MTDRIWIGTSGWVYAHWRGVFYPSDLAQSKWFDYYSSQFGTVEINNTFYRLPREAVFDRWREQAPKDFAYAVKASRFITHVKRLSDAAEPVKLFLSRAVRLGPHLGPILYQLPPKWHADPERLEEFASALPRNRSHVFEFRDADWFQDAVREVLSRYGLSFCLFDRAGLKTPEWVAGSLVYVRFHGSSAAEGRYTHQELAAWAEQIRAWLDDDREVYAYFNNDAFGHAVTNARELRDML